MDISQELDRSGARQLRAPRRRGVLQVNEVGARAFWRRSSIWADKVLETGVGQVVGVEDPAQVVPRRRVVGHQRDVLLHESWKATMISAFP